jgi:DNA-binding NtrC family response regulator
VLERAQILAEDHVITLDDLPETVTEAAVEAPAGAAAGDPRHLREIERRHVEQVLQQERGNKVQAARALGISRRALYRLIDKYRLEGYKSEAAERGA